MNKQKFAKYIIFVALVLALVCGYVVYIWRFSSSQRNFVMPAITVQVATVKMNDLPIEVHAIGQLVSARSVDVTSEISGHVAKVYYPDGGVPVKAGTLLLQLDDGVLKAKLAEAEASLVYSQTDYDRKKQLGTHGAISKQAIDQALADLKIKRATLDEAKVDLAHTQLFAPFTGMLGKMNVTPGDYVTVGQKIVSLTDVSHLRAEYAIPEKYLSYLHLDQSVQVKTNIWPNQTFPGFVTFIAPTINSDDRTISIFADVPNENHALTAGLFVDIVQSVGMKSQVLTVPATSLVSVMNGQKIFRVENNKVESVLVSVIARSEQAVQVSGALNVGDVVVTAGQQKLSDGASVVIN